MLKTKAISTTIPFRHPKKKSVELTAATEGKKNELAETELFEGFLVFSSFSTLFTRRKTDRGKRRRPITDRAKNESCVSGAACDGWVVACLSVRHPDSHKLVHFVGFP